MLDVFCHPNPLKQQGLRHQRCSNDSDKASSDFKPQVEYICEGKDWSRCLRYIQNHSTQQSSLILQDPCCIILKGAIPEWQGQNYCS